VNMRRVGRCPNCRQVWQAEAGSWENGNAPRCPDCMGFLVKFVPDRGDRADIIADHLARGGRKARYRAHRGQKGGR
jgi:hypothetical protein